MVKAFLEAEIKGWTDACADPTRPAPSWPSTSTARTSTRRWSSTRRSSRPSSSASTLVITDETKANGLFTISDELIDGQHRRRSRPPASTSTADDLFDTSLLDELYEEKPDLKCADR